MLMRVELWDDNLVIPPGIAARAAVLAFGDELVDLELPNDADSQWLSQGGREMAAAYLLPRAEAALRQELQRLADAVKLAQASAHPRPSRTRRTQRPRTSLKSVSLLHDTHEPSHITPAQVAALCNSRAA